MTAFWYGMGTWFSLIVAIGAQNTFVIKQGLKKQYVFWICLICAISDTFLVFGGVTGFKFMRNYPALITWTTAAGILFLLLYGAKHAYAAIRMNAVFSPSQLEKDSLLKIILLCLALTWLNPHIYVDTFILMGPVSAQFPDHTIAFALGAILVSWLFFFGLGYGASILSPVFQSVAAWRILDMLIAVIMWAIALSLLRSIWP